jgi:hypothetical protein
MIALLACAVCAQQTNTPSTLLLLAVIAAPFAIAAIVVRAIRHVDS